jgi:hypothetical protein
MIAGVQKLVWRRFSLCGVFGAAMTSDLNLWGLK